MIYLALVTFEHDGDDGDRLPFRYQGACGWVAVQADEEIQAAENVGRAFSAMRLKVVELDQLQPVLSADEIIAIDPHLAENVRNLEQGQNTVWGTIHCYVGERAN